tara:strand:- start:3581 stop:4126 length:546 start_codon:yes stop_codon:yes gene_type:complete
MGIIAINRNKAHQEKTKKSSYEGSTISLTIEDGECSVDSTIEIAGIEIHLSGGANISPSMPEGWVFEGYKNKLLSFSTNLQTINNRVIFRYEGHLEISKAYFFDRDGQPIPYKIVFSKTKMIDQEWTFDTEDVKWREHGTQPKRTKSGISYRKQKGNPLNDLPEYQELKRQIRNKITRGGY